MKKYENIIIILKELHIKMSVSSISSISSDANNFVEPNEKTSKKLSAKHLKFMVFGYWFSKKMKESNVLSDEQVGNIHTFLRIHLPPAEQNEFYEEFADEFKRIEGELKMNIKEEKKRAKQQNKPKKSKKENKNGEKPEKKRGRNKVVKPDNMTEQEKIIHELVNVANGVNIEDPEPKNEERENDVIPAEEVKKGEPEPEPEKPRKYNRKPKNAEKPVIPVEEEEKLPEAIPIVEPILEKPKKADKAEKPKKDKTEKPKKAEKPKKEKAENPKKADKAEKPKKTDEPEKKNPPADAVKKDDIAENDTKTKEAPKNNIVQEDAEEEEEEEDAEDMTVRELNYNGETYYIDDDNIVYDKIEPHPAVGVYDKINDAIHYYNEKE